MPSGETHRGKVVRKEPALRSVRGTVSSQDEDSWDQPCLRKRDLPGPHKQQGQESLCTPSWDNVDLKIRKSC